jgi:hypothetical protein
MIYAVSTHSNLDLVAEGFVFSLNFPSPIDVHIIIIIIIIIIQVFKCLNISISNFCAARFLVDSLSLTFATIR